MKTTNAHQEVQESLMEEKLLRLQISLVSTDKVRCEHCKGISEESLRNQERVLECKFYSRKLFLLSNQMLKSKDRMMTMYSDYSDWN